MQTLNGYNDRSFKHTFQQRRTKQNPLLWWLKLTSIPDPPEDASFIQRDAARRSRLISIIASFLLILFVIYLPGDIILRSVPSLISTIAILPVAWIAILLNRSGRTFAAGMVIVCAAEIALSSVVLTTPPFGIANVQSYGLLVIGELLSVSLLPGRSVFVAAFYNSLVITGSLLYQPKTAAMAQVVQHQFVALLSYPIGVQFLVAGVTYLWVSSTLRAIARADHAEVVASLEREIGKQATMVAEEKLFLEAKINEVVQFHINTMSSGVSVKFPFSEDTKMLWPLINVIHSLQRRVQRSLHTDFELHRLRKAIMEYADFVHGHNLVQLEQWPQTKTELDLLLYAIMQQIHVHPDLVSHHTVPAAPEGNPALYGSGPVTQGENPASYGSGPVTQGDNSATQRRDPITFGGNLRARGIPTRKF